MTWRLNRVTDVQRGSPRDVTAERFGEVRFVVRIDLRIVPAAREGHVGEAPIDQLLPAGLSIDVDEARSAVTPWVLWLVTA